MKCAAAWFCGLVVAFHGLAWGKDESLHLRVTWGHRSPAAVPVFLAFVTTNVTLAQIRSLQFEGDDRLAGRGAITTAGAGDIDGVEVLLHFEARGIEPITNLHSIWAHLLAHGDPGAARRLRQDPAFRPDDRKLTLHLDPEGTKGFSLTADQLLTRETFWVPDLDILLSPGGRASAEEPPVTGGAQGKRIRDATRAAPEPSYATFTRLWEDMGNPAYRNPHAVPPGHIVGLTWDSASYKFGVDRWAGVRNDYGNPDQFRLAFSLTASKTNGTGSWKGQKLDNGLPFITTTLEENGCRYQVESFAFPLDGPPVERNGELPMVLLQKVSISNTGSAPKEAVFSVRHERKAGPGLTLRHDAAEGYTLSPPGSGACYLAVQGADLFLRTNHCPGPGTNDLTFSARLAARENREFLVKLPSPVVPAEKVATLLALDYSKAREQTVSFWEQWLARGAQFRVPEDAVNHLFRANLWHALRLPRRHRPEADGQVVMDLPYSNFAYDQRGTPWPVNQAVYVDYMLYDLRGHHAVAAEELDAIFRTNQEPNGHVKGYANWGVYTPGMVYAVANHFLLSGDRPSFERLLPNTLRATDWCLEQLKASGEHPGAARGLVLRPLNDLSHENRAWAFNQAYFFAGLEAIGRALALIDHPRAAECRAAAARVREAVALQFSRASAASPLVQLRDRTWSPCVPADALTPGRQLQVWYPTDVDTGPLHLSRLQALDPSGPLTTFMLNDHEDNLFLGGLGMANEPVYNQQATAYLLRDEVAMVVRAFYSMMACAFSHSVFEPVEHRWGWGQYFGPPSTDGAWFELYRNMLLRETDENTLLLMQAAPREWFGAGKAIHVADAPTWFGRLSFDTASASGGSEITAKVRVPDRRPPSTLLVRFRHPAGAPMRSVYLNGEVWNDFDPAKEWVRISPVNADTYHIRVTF